MLQDVPGLLNPIVQTMIAHANQLRMGRQQDIEQERNQAEIAARKEQLKQAQQILENTHQHQLSMDEAERLRSEAESTASRANTLLHLNTLAAQGGGGAQFSQALMPDVISRALQNVQKYNFHQPQATPESLGYSPINGGVPDNTQPSTPGVSSLFTTPEAEAQRVRNLAFGESAGKSEGALPSEQTLAGQKFGYEQTLQNARLASEEKVAGLGRQTQENIAKLSRQTQENIAALARKTQLQMAGMGDDEKSHQLMQSIQYGLATGDFKLNPVNPLERMAYATNQAAGFHDVDPKEIDALKTSQQQMLPLLDRMEKWASTLPEGRAGANIQGALVRGANAAGISTAKQNEINLINSQAMNVGRSVEGIGGRPLSTQLKLDLDTLASPNITKQDAIDRINNLRDLYVNKQNNTIFSGMPDAQKEIIKQKYGVTPVAQQSPQTLPDWLRIAPKTNTNGKALNTDESLKRGHPVYGGQ
jgi:hypothetical protein